uniref:Zgc:110843 n=1 Tax=Cynoglossus semilaevis TaxID=244447 RepID=A0A3P8VIB1_CYNSE
GLTPLSPVESPPPPHLVVAVPVAVVAAVGGFLVGHYLTGRSCKKGQVNTCVSKDSPKVVHSFDMEDIGTKAVYCRCWKSKKVRLAKKAKVMVIIVNPKDG